MWHHLWFHNRVARRPDICAYVYRVLLLLCVLLYCCCCCCSSSYTCHPRGSSYKQHYLLSISFYSERKYFSNPLAVQSFLCGLGLFLYYCFSWPLQACAEPQAGVSPTPAEPPLYYTVICTGRFLIYKRLKLRVQQYQYTLQNFLACRCFTFSFCVFVCVFFSQVFFHSKVIGACLVTTDCVMAMTKCGKNNNNNNNNNNNTGSIREGRIV